MKTLVIVWLFLAIAMPARATVIVPADLTELTRDARAIVRGRVIALDPRWTEDRRSVETIVTLEVEAYLKGALGQILQFRVAGGELGRFRSITVGAPSFSIDERIVVFLGTDGPSVPHVLGLNQGVYRVIRRTDGWAVTPPPALPTASAPTRIIRGDVTRQPLALPDFESRVRAIVAGAR